jgi:hypothetical protein
MLYYLYSTRTKCQMNKVISSIKNNWLPWLAQHKILMLACTGAVAGGLTIGVLLAQLKPASPKTDKTGQNTPAEQADNKKTATETSDQTEPTKNAEEKAAEQPKPSAGTAGGGGQTSTGGSGATETAGLTNPGIITNYSGSYTINSGTVVIENKAFTNRLTVNGGNVTIRNSTFNFEDYYHILVNGGTVTVEHSEFDGMNTTSMADDLGITGDNITVRWSTFKRFVNALRPGSNSLIERNVISNPNTAHGPAHTDGIEVYGGSNITIRYNSINISGGAGETGCVNIATDFGDISNVTVEGNDFTGGTYSFYARLQGAGNSITNIHVVNNRWHTPHIYGTHSVIPTSSVVEWNGSTLNGSPLAF